MMHGGNLIRGYGQGQGMVMNAHGWWFGLIPLAAHLIFFIILIIVGIILLRRHSARVRLYRKQNDPALRILRERYALGEIDTEEFQRRNQDLRS
ncbi:SHOCT domain-containing protein [Desulfosporosinus sp. PR]|uniref:SHOCT domain-containing protein n=1 Tax=Candidatus Desulfosporosinus nitrosoreducens TaxID=3401928 RepID=UPI0027F76486|nr:SHOCT domain-containing protein [Desulfosporosinus sp. PR]MDQ7095992.1 SHOCT domain-containing protein [Desulfosporosinus sp. PR]